MTNEQQALVEKHVEWAKHFSHGYKRPGISREDLEQEAILALCVAAERFEGRNGAQFKTYAYKWVRARLLKTVNQRTWESLDQPIDTTEGEILTLKDILPANSPTSDDLVNTKLQNEHIHGLLRQLPSSERVLIEQYYGLSGYKPQTLRELCTYLNLRSKQSVLNRLRGVLRKLRRQLTRKNGFVSNNGGISGEITQT